MSLSYEDISSAEKTRLANLESSIRSHFVSNLQNAGGSFDGTIIDLCLAGSWAVGYAVEKSDYDVLIVHTPSTKHIGRKENKRILKTTLKSFELSSEITNGFSPKFVMATDILDRTHFKDADGNFGTTDENTCYSLRYNVYFKTASEAVSKYQAEGVW